MSTAGSTGKSRLEQIAALLRSHGVEFIVIGGQAEVLYGSPRVTADVDLCYRRTPENLGRLAAALSEIDPSLRGAPPGLPFRPDAATLGAGCNFTLVTSLGDLDLLGHVEPLGGFEELAERCEVVDVDGLPLAVIGLDQLILIKSHLGRPRDREALLYLEPIKRMREDDRRSGRG
ncbi:MAG: hypothetical protein WD749_09765 [Phycisphaerales bacterium]